MGVEFLPHAVGESIGGIDEDEVEARPRSGPRRVPPASAPASARTSSARSPRPRRSTLPSAGRVSRSTRTAPRGAARERLDRQRAGAAVEVEDAGAVDPVAERREDRLADAVGGRPHLPAARRDQALPLQLSGDDPHRTALEWDRVGGAGAEAAAGGVEQRAEGRGVERAVAAQQGQHLLAGLEQQRRRPRAARRRRSAAGRAGGCRGPRPRRAAPRSTSASLKPSRSPATACSRRRASSPASSANSRQWEGCSPRPTRPRSWCSWETP